MKTGGLRNKKGYSSSTDISPLLTIITIVRNGEQIIEETIKSVVNQKYNNMEYIIIDGGSTDNTVDVIKKYENSIDFWISEPDKGIYDAMNKGVLFATGKYVNFMNAGDIFFDSNVCDKVANNILVNNSDVIYGDFVAFNDKFNSEIYVKSRPLSKIWTGMIFCHQSVFVKTKILLHFPFDLKYKIVADFKQILAVYNEGYDFEKVEIPISKIAIDGVSYSNMKTIVETIKVIYSIKPYSISVVYFLSQFLKSFFRIIIGEKLTELIRKYKWKFKMRNC